MCDDCKQCIPAPAKDWLVTKLTDRGPGHYYRYRVEGENLNFPVGHRERMFSWSVPSLHKRYDLSKVGQECSICRQRHGREIEHACE